MTPEFKKLFIADYLKHCNASRAARNMGLRAYRGPQILGLPDVRKAVEEAIEQRLEDAKAHGSKVIAEWLKIIDADPNEIVHVRRTCCRYCWGTDNKYQFTQHERDQAHASWQLTDAALVAEFDEQGGVGFDPTVDVNLECAHCFGEGHASLYVADTRDLTPNGRALFAGVKQNKDGSIEVKLHSKEKALEMVARHLGMLNDKMDVKAAMSLQVVTGVPDAE